jgi:deazaflavin-dependent oxidoreductase (nitroreductase family)
MSRRVAAFTHRSAQSRPTAVAWSRLHAWILRHTRGLVGGRWLGAPVLVLETVGRRSGKVRHTPLLYVTDGDRLVLLAANAGNDRPPAWWLNLRAADAVAVLVRGRRRQLTWTQAEGAERDRLFAQFVKVYPPAAHYEQFTQRELPVVVLADVS